MEEWINNMYEFQDTKRNHKAAETFIPTVAMAYDGVYIENLIEGYQTLSVEGREMLSLDIEQQDIQLGAIITNQTLPARSITVTYKLADNNPERLQFKFKELINYLYRTEDVEIKFHDEMDYCYFGRYSSADTVAGDSNSIISNFTILCVDPLRYTREFESSGYIGATTAFPVTPTKIKANVDFRGALEITNGEQTISMSDANLTAGNIVTFNFSDERVTVDDNDITSMIDLTSDFENFVLKQGQTVTTNNGTVTIFYRGATI